MTRSPNCGIFLLLLLLSSYAICSCSKLAAAIKKVDSPTNEHKLGEQYTPEHQISHALAIKDEARQKRSQRDLSSSELREFNNIITDLEDNSIAQAAAAGTGAGTGMGMGVGVSQPQELDFEHMPPLIYYLLLEKLRQLQSIEPTYRVRTPRLGRSIDFRRFDATFGHGGSNVDDEGSVAVGNDDDAVARAAAAAAAAGGMRRQKQFVSRLIKKSVPFKPRLGKRTQQPTMLCD